MKTAVLMATGAAGLIALSVADAAYRVRDWGAADGEVSAALPGDEILPGPLDVHTLAVSVAAPAPTTWRELVRSATGEPSRREPVRREPAAGDVLRGLPGAPSGLTDGPLRVVRVVPGRALVLVPDRADADLADPDGWSGPEGEVYSFHVVPTTPGRCRLLFRRRTCRAGIGRVVTQAVEPLVVVLTRRAMLGVAERAERRGQVVVAIR